ncbi:hypothetical protein WA026_021772 [Henosepilachna vigintioctopunctata]|uniref:Uncharacterized protein n=1 Tax=Henosepilachna vigintioctopunctata TaxID=420089 RepID=A0AAW1TX34_9CUCU
MRLLLEERQVLVALEKDLAATSTEQERSQFLMIGAKAKSIIVQCATDKHLDIIKDSTTDKNMIKSLGDVFERESVFTKLTLKKKSSTMKCCTGEKLEESLIH